MAAHLSLMLVMVLLIWSLVPPVAAHAQEGTTEVAAVAPVAAAPAAPPPAPPPAPAAAPAVEAPVVAPAVEAPAAEVPAVEAPVVEAPAPFVRSEAAPEVRECPDPEGGPVPVEVPVAELCPEVMPDEAVGDADGAGESTGGGDADAAPAVDETSESTGEDPGAVAGGESGSAVPAETVAAASSSPGNYQRGGSDRASAVSADVAPFQRGGPVDDVVTGDPIPSGVEDRSAVLQQTGDRDSDGVDDSTDNCPDTYNPDQGDRDGDGVGNACSDDADFDGDGIANGSDNCPAAPNPGQDPAACTQDDHDGDGVANTVDNCDTVPNADQADTDGDGVGDACADEGDPDGDGIANAVDNCPAVANPDQSDTDGDSLGDACDGGAAQPSDGDGDGVPDVSDNCPAAANADQSDADANGVGDACEQPAPAPQATASDFTVQAGGSTVLTGSGWLPGGNVTATLVVQDGTTSFSATPVLLGTATVDAAGNFSLPVTIPASVPPGQHAIVMSGVDANGLPRTVTVPMTILGSVTGSGGVITAGGAPVEVTEFGTAATGVLEPVVAQQLAATGASTSMLALAALAAMSVGMMLLLLERSSTSRAVLATVPGIVVQTPGQLLDVHGSAVTRDVAPGEGSRSLWHSARFSGRMVLRMVIAQRWNRR